MICFTILVRIDNKLKYVAAKKIQIIYRKQFCDIFRLYPKLGIHCMYEGEWYCILLLISANKFFGRLFVLHMGMNVHVKLLLALILKSLMALCQLLGNNFSILTVVLSGFDAENYTWFSLGIFELDMAFLIQCALVRSEPRCSRSIAALLNKGSFLPSSQYLCQVGLDSRPSPRPHWASHQSRDPPSCFPIGCGLQLTHPLS